MDIFFKKAAEMADGVLDLTSWFGKRIESKKNLAKPEDLIGLSAEVTASIKKGAVGEVVVVAGESRLNYSARADDTELEFNKGEMVTVIRAGSSVLFVAKQAKTKDTSKIEDEHKADGHSCCNHDH